MGVSRRFAGRIDGLPLDVELIEPPSQNDLGQGLHIWANC